MVLVEGKECESLFEELTSIYCYYRTSSPFTGTGKRLCLLALQDFTPIAAATNCPKWGDMSWGQRRSIYVYSFAGRWYFIMLLGFLS